MKNHLAKGDRVHHPLYGDGTVIVEAFLAPDHFLVHYDKKSLGAPNGFQQVTVPQEVKRIGRNR